MTDLLITNVRALEPGKGVIAAWVRMTGGKIAALGPADRLPERRFANDRRRRTTADAGPDRRPHARHRAVCLRSRAGANDRGLAAARPIRHDLRAADALSLDVAGRSCSELEQLAAALSSAEDACMPGLHLEGPFLAVPGAGAQTIPGDVGLLDELLVGRRRHAWPPCRSARKCRTSCRSSSGCANVAIVPLHHAHPGDGRADRSGHRRRRSPRHAFLRRLSHAARRPIRACGRSERSRRFWPIRAARSISSPTASTCIRRPSRRPWRQKAGKA